MKKDNLNEGIINPSQLCMDVKRSVPDSIPEIQRFILCKEEELLKLRSDPDEDISPYNPSQLNSAAILYAEIKIGYLLKESGADKDDRLLPEGIDREECDFLILHSAYDQFIEGALRYVVTLARDVNKCRFLKIGPNGDKILKQLINKDIVKEIFSETVRLKYNTDINIEEVRNIAGPDFDKVWAIFQRSNPIVTWNDIWLQAVVYRKLMP